MCYDYNDVDPHFKQIVLIEFCDVKIDFGLACL